MADFGPNQGPLAPDVARDARDLHQEYRRIMALTQQVGEYDPENDPGGEATRRAQLDEIWYHITQLREYIRIRRSAYAPSVEPTIEEIVELLGHYMDTEIENVMLDHHNLFQSILIEFEPVEIRRRLEGSIGDALEGLTQEQKQRFDEGLQVVYDSLGRVRNRLTRQTGEEEENMIQRTTRIGERTNALRETLDSYLRSARRRLQEEEQRAAAERGFQAGGRQQHDPPPQFNAGVAPPEGRPRPEMPRGGWNGTPSTPRPPIPPPAQGFGSAPIPRHVAPHRLGFTPPTLRPAPVAHVQEGNQPPWRQQGFNPRIGGIRNSWGQDTSPNLGNQIGENGSFVNGGTAQHRLETDFRKAVGRFKQDELPFHLWTRTFRRCAVQYGQDCEAQIGNLGSLLTGKAALYYNDCLDDGETDIEVILQRIRKCLKPEKVSEEHIQDLVKEPQRE
ncbi:MAG: hypothetical protein GY696_07895, partial [Gammaproteobacteria bacterium]|nr:hypothetical protein [Gammaproteobacteria bacterium]